MMRTAALGLLIALAAAAAARGQTPPDVDLEAQVRAVASQLRCVVCQGLSIQDSPSDLAKDMKAVVREQLAAGRTPEEVKNYFVSKYGEWVLLQPRPAGLNLAVYILPFAALLGGAFFLFRVVRRWTREGAAAMAAAEDSAAVGAGPGPGAQGRAASP